MQSLIHRWAKMQNALAQIVVLLIAIDYYFKKLQICVLNNTQIILKNYFCSASIGFQLSIAVLPHPRGTLFKPQKTQFQTFFRKARGEPGSFWFSFISTLFLSTFEHSVTQYKTF